jgi:hypothetical protein
MTLETLGTLMTPTMTRRCLLAQYVTTILAAPEAGKKVLSDGAAPLATPIEKLRRAHARCR